MTRRVVLALIVALGWQVGASGLQDEVWLNSHLNPKGYYEGLLDQPNAKQEYEVLGFFAYATTDTSKLDRALKPTLQAWFYLPQTYEDHQPIADNAVVLRARQVASRTNYLLQSAPGGIVRVPGTGWRTIEWATEPYITKFDIDPNELGIIAKPDDPADVHLFAVMLSTPSACRPQQLHNYELILKIQRYSLANLSYVIGPAAGNTAGERETCYYMSSSKPCGKQLEKGAGIDVGTVLRLPFDVNAPDPGWRSLHISGRYKDSSEGIDVTYLFFHQPAFQCK